MTRTVPEWPGQKSGNSIPKQSRPTNSKRDRNPALRGGRVGWKGGTREMRSWFRSGVVWMCAGRYVITASIRAAVRHRCRRPRPRPRNAELAATCTCLGCYSCRRRPFASRKCRRPAVRMKGISFFKFPATSENTYFLFFSFIFSGGAT